MNRALAMQPDDELIPGRDDLADFVQPGESDIDPRNFIRPDGRYDVTPVNFGKPEHAEAVREHMRRLRDATPCPIPYPNREGESL